MTQKEIVEKCKEKGIDYTFYHIWRIGLKEGFFIKDAEDNFDEVKFNAWLDSVSHSIPDDCMFLVDAVKEYGVNYAVITHYFKVNNIGMFKDDVPHNRKFYARKSDIERAVESHNRRTSGRN